VCELLTADALRVSTYTSRMSCVTPRVAGHGLRQVMTGHAVSMLSQTAVFDMRGRLSVEFSSLLNRSATERQLCRRFTGTVTKCS